MSDEGERRELREALAGNPSLRRLGELTRLATALAGTLDRALSGGPTSISAFPLLDLRDPRTARLSVECLLFFWAHGEGMSIDIELEGVWVEVGREKARYFPFAIKQSF